MRTVNGPVSIINLNVITKPGDVLLVKGPWHVRVATGESFSHVAMVFQNGRQLMISEYNLGGYKEWTFDAWYKAQKGRPVMLGFVPDSVNQTMLVSAIDKYKGRPYSFLAGIRVWWSTLTGKRTSAGMVCSTYIQKCWEFCGFPKKGKLFDPGDFLQEVDTFCAVDP
jgi:cell wall-associated NlpC family hydrolase